MDSVLQSGYKKHILRSIVAQCSLKSVIMDDVNCLSDRWDAMVLYAWIGSLEANIDELVFHSSWAAEIIVEAMKKYGPAFPNDSNFLYHYSEALDSLQYHLGKITSSLPTSTD